MRPMPFALLLAAAAATAPLAPATAQQAPLRVPGVSTAGNAVLEKMQSRTDPAVPAQVEAARAVQARMRAILEAPTFDVEKFAATMAQARAVAANARKISDDQLLTVLRALPPADRKPFLRSISTAQVQPGAAPARPGR